MIEFTKSHLLSVAVAFVTICLLGPLAAAQTSSADLAKFFAQYFEERLRDDPEFATTVGRHEYDDRWSDLSKQGREQRRAHLQQRFDQLQKFGTQGLGEQDALSVRLLSYDLRTQLDALDLETYLLRVGQLYGSHTRIYLTIDRMPAFTVKDCENIIARLHAVPAYVDQNIAILNEAIERGLTQPKIVADLVTDQLKAQVGQDAATTPLLEFLKKMPLTFPRPNGRDCASRRRMLSRTIFVRRGANCSTTCRRRTRPMSGRKSASEACVTGR